MAGLVGVGMVLTPVFFISVIFLRRKDMEIQIHGNLNDPAALCALLVFFIVPYECWTCSSFMSAKCG